MPVHYDSKKIIPAPYVSISKEVTRSEDGTPRKIGFIINVKGTLSASKGSPNSSGVFWSQSGYPPDETISHNGRLRSIIAKQAALMNLFCDDYKLFEVQPFDGTAPLKAIAKVRSINFEEGNWYDFCKYNITLEAEQLWFGNVQVCGGGTAETTPAEESWSIEQADERGLTYRVQHTISSQAKELHSADGVLIKRGWEVARGIVLSGGVLGLDSNIYAAGNALVLTGRGAFNYVRSQQIDESNGKYSVSESWLLFNTSSTGGTPCTEEYTANTRIGEDGRIRVSVEGTLTGLEVRNNTTYELLVTRLTNVNARWGQLEGQLFNIASSASGITLNPNQLAKTIGRNIINGTISFSVEYDNRPIVYSGAISATIQSTETRPVDIFASLVVIGKANGPVLQSIFTKTARKRSVSIEIVMPPANMNSSPAQPSTDGLLSPYSPGGGFVDKDDITWSAQTGRYSRQVSWTWV